MTSISTLRAILLTLGCLVALSACWKGNPYGTTATNETPATTAAARSPIVASPVVLPVTYGGGFYPPERDSSGQSWRWMGKAGSVILANNRRNSRLRISAGAPVDNAVFHLDMNGEKLDEVRLKVGNFEKVYDIPAGRQGAFTAFDLHLVMSATVFGEADGRQLGLRVFDISWSAD